MIEAVPEPALWSHLVTWCLTHDQNVIGCRRSEPSTKGRGKPCPNWGEQATDGPVLACPRCGDELYDSVLLDPACNESVCPHCFGFIRTTRSGRLARVAPNVDCTLHGPNAVESTTAS